MGRGGRGLLVLVAVAGACGGEAETPTATTYRAELRFEAPGEGIVELHDEVTVDTETQGWSRTITLFRDGRAEPPLEVVVSGDSVSVTPGYLEPVLGPDPQRWARELSGSSP